MVDSTIDNLMKNETLAGGAQEDLAGKKMREGKREGEEESPADGDKGLRERWMDAKRAMDLKQRAKDKLEEKVMAPAKKGTSRGLQWAWKTLIPSYGTSFLWIDIHVFLRWVFGDKLFCKLGDEWIPKQVAGSEAAKTAGSAIRISETIVWLLINAVLFCLVIFIVGFFINEDMLETMQKESTKSAPAQSAPAAAQPQISQ